MAGLPIRLLRPKTRPDQMIHRGSRPVEPAMLAHVATTAFPAFRPALRRRLPMSGQPEAAELNALLVRVATARDRAAFGALFAHFAPRIKSYLMRQGAAPALAEDLAQEAMLTCGARRICLIPPRRLPAPGCSPSPATCASTCCASPSLHRWRTSEWRACPSGYYGPKPARIK